MYKVLIVDDENQLRALLARIIGLEGFDVIQAADCVSALKTVRLQKPEIIICDVKLPDGNGVEMIAEFKKIVPHSEVILLTAYGNIADGVKAIKNGAFDYLTKGNDNNKIIPLLNRVVENLKSISPEKCVPNKSYVFEDILGDSLALRQAIDLAKKVSRTDVPVLLTGETGTGKEVFAQAIHSASASSGHRFVAINCAAFSKELLESELFGHKAGSFTGAMKDKKGLFEMAHNGTIFLDEIGEMTYELQAKLLRVLEAGEFIKIGDTSPTFVNVRLIAATNRNLEKEIAMNNFREDLYYRLSVFHIELPPLRERAHDIPLYVKSFVELFSLKMRKKIDSVSPDFMKTLEKQPWKGNLRELRNVIERSIIISDNGKLSVADLPVEMLKQENCDMPQSTMMFELSEIEKQHIQKILQYTGFNKTETARLLKIGLTTLYRKIEEYQLIMP